MYSYFAIYHSHPCFTYVFLEFTKIIIATGKCCFGDYLNNLELIDLNGGCSSYLPEYPISLAGATGIFIDDKIIICGGIDKYMHYHNKCYQLQHENYSFQLVYSMKEKRSYAKSILTQSNMLVTGGNKGINQFIGTAEYINVQLGNNTAPMPDIQLPKPTSEHAIIKMNKTTAF